MFRSIRYFVSKKLHQGVAIDRANSAAPEMFRVLASADNADQYFISPAKAKWTNTWRGTKLTPNYSKNEHSEISGSRLRSVKNEDAKQDEAALTQTQYDLSHVISGLNRLREHKQFANVVIGPGQDITRIRHGRAREARALFSLLIPRNNSTADTVNSATICHKRIRKTITRAGYRVVSPRKFDPTTGMNGLELWASQVILRRRLVWPWFLLFFPLLFFIQDCQCGRLPTALGLPAVGSQSYLLLIDTSGSMDTGIQIAREHIHELINDTHTRRQSRNIKHINVISYNHAADSALGSLQPMNPEVTEQLEHYVNNLRAGGGTQLAAAFDQAATEIRAIQTPTTIHIITDARDDSIPRLLHDADALKRELGEDVTMYATSPRALAHPPGTGRTPQTTDERQLDQLMRHFGGRFGAKGDTQ